MPRLTELAKHGASFSRAYASAPYTTDSMRSIVTGQPVMNMSVQWQQAIGAEPTIAERLSAAGYDTSLVMYPWWHKDDVWIVQDGIQNMVLVERPPDGSELLVTGPPVTELALAELQRLVAKDQPFLLWIHYLDPHAEYIPRAGTPYSDRGDPKSRYAQEVWSTDRDIGRIVDALDDQDFFSRGVVLVHSDHGELIEDEGRTGHAYWLDEDVLRTVLVLRGPEVTSGVYETRVRMLDIAPTLLRMAMGMSISVFGQDLGPVLDRSERADRDVIVYSPYETTRQSAILSGSYKLVQDYMKGTASLYDLARDPKEERNLIEVERKRAGELKTRFGRVWDASINDAVLARHARLTVEGMCARGDQRACAALKP
jgi:arylsulfatase A-like enzyme